MDSSVPLSLRPMHGLLQAFSRTNRILNSIKTFGNIVCLRNLQKRVDAAIALFGAILWMRNLLLSFDEFKGKELISERDLQDYLGRYQDLRDEWVNRAKGENEDINDDIIFETELIRQSEINIDYILMLVKKYHDSNRDDKEILITIQKAVDASPELRSKKQLIETFIAGISDVDDVMEERHGFVAVEREKELTRIIQKEKLKEPETKKSLENAFRGGEIKTIGRDIDKLMPPVSRFGEGGARAKRKRTVIDKLKGFFERFFGIVEEKARHKTRCIDRREDKSQSSSERL